MSSKVLILSEIVIVLLAGVNNSLAGVSGSEIGTDTAAAAIKKAPDCPAAQELPAGAVLVDFIDCAADSGLRAFADDGRSTVAESPAGRYRITGVNDNAFFSYRFRAGKPNAPHVIVAQYPDDDERTVTIFLHESKMRGLYNSDFHIEGGYSSGAEYPNSGDMKNMLIYFWPEDQSPAIVCLNEHHFKPAAMSKIWVYEIATPLSQTPVNFPKNLPRRNIGIFFEDSRMFRYNFGRGKDSVEHCVKYLKHTGQNLLSYDVVLYSYPKCNLPILPGDDTQLVEVLNACDKYDIDFVAVFDPTASAKINGTATGDLEKDAAVEAWSTVVEQFVDKYGTHRSLKGISFGGPAGCNRILEDKLADLQLRINKILQKKAPQVTQHIFFGYKWLHRVIFHEADFRTDKIIADWESSASKGETFRAVLAKWVDKYYKSIKLEISDYANLSNVMIHRSFYDNDQRCFQFYPLRLPRWMVMRDFTRASEVAALLDGPDTLGACLFGSYFEVTTGLFGNKDTCRPGSVSRNFWWDRTWIASQINPSENYFPESYTNALDKDDCTFIMNSSWVNPIIGSPHLVRKFAKSYLTLPAFKFDTIARNDYVVVRQLLRDGQLWFYLLNNHSSDADVELSFSGDGGEITHLVSGDKITVSSTMTVKLAAFELACYRVDSPRSNLADIRVSRQKSSHLALKQRIADFAAYIRTLQDMGQQVPAPYLELRRQVSDLYTNGQYQQADELLGWTPSNELMLRTHLASGREIFPCRKSTGNISIDGNLDEWSDAAFVDIADESRLVCDRWLYNWWRDTDDLSARIWASYDDQNLYLAFDVHDDINRSNDGISFAFDTENYTSNREMVKPKLSIGISAPQDKSQAGMANNRVIIKTDYGYRGEMAVPLSKIGISSTASTSFGFHAMLTDTDLAPEQFQKLIKNRRVSWRRGKRMEWPFNPYFIPGRDAQSCGIMRLE